MIVTVTPSATSGTWVNWYEDHPHWRESDAIVWASRHGVWVNGWLDRIPDGILSDAQDVAQILKHDRHANVDSFATHEVHNGELIALPGADQCTCLGSCKKLDCDCVCHQMPSHGDKGE